MHGQQQPRTLEGAFQQYTRSSGSGSTLPYAEPYVAYLTNFLLYHGDTIRLIADVGCGDQTLMAEVMRQLDEHGVKRPEYLGVDAVPGRVELNRQLHPDLPCFVGDARDSGAIDDVGVLRSADLVIVKDVLQHWDTLSIEEWLHDCLADLQDPLSPYPQYILITNCARGDNVNADIVMGDWRPLDLSQPPFELCKPLDGPGSIVLSWDTKDVVLLRKHVRVPR